MTCLNISTTFGRGSQLRTQLYWQIHFDLKNPFMRVETKNTSLYNNLSISKQNVSQQKSFKFWHKKKKDKTKYLSLLFIQ